MGFELGKDFNVKEIKMNFSIDLKRNNQKHTKQELMRFELNKGFNYNQSNLEDFQF